MMSFVPLWSFLALPDGQYPTRISHQLLAAKPQRHPSTAFTHALRGGRSPGRLWRPPSCSTQNAGLGPSVRRAGGYACAPELSRAPYLRALAPLAQVVGGRSGLRARVRQTMTRPTGSRLGYGEAGSVPYLPDACGALKALGFRLPAPAVGAIIVHDGCARTTTGRPGQDRPGWKVRDLQLHAEQGQTLSSACG